MGSVVQVWQIPLQLFPEQPSLTHRLLNTYLECLSPDEKDKAARFHFPADRRRFAVARGTLRHLIARQLDQQPQEVTFCYGTYGKPAIDLSRRPLPKALTESECCFHFNLSHSGEIALCALGYERAVGIDIEKVRPIERLDGMMKRTLLAKEQHQVELQAAPSHAFLQRWTCKEAYLKAIGLGLTQSMQTVEVQIDPPKLLQVPEDCADGWYLHLMDLPTGYVGALVIAGKAVVTQHQWQHRLLPADDNG